MQNKYSLIQQPLCSLSERWRSSDAAEQCADASHPCYMLYQSVMLPNSVQTLPILAICCTSQWCCRTVCRRFPSLLYYVVPVRTVKFNYRGSPWFVVYYARKKRTMIHEFVHRPELVHLPVKINFLFQRTLPVNLRVLMCKTIYILQV